jgi:hypothetical protein
MPHSCPRQDRDAGLCRYQRFGYGLVEPSAQKRHHRVIAWRMAGANFLSGFSRARGARRARLTAALGSATRRMR